MKYKIIGVQKKAGTFTDRESGKEYAYDNINLHCIGRDMTVTGECVKMLKLKTEYAGDLLKACANDLHKLVGRTVDFELGAYDRIVSYEVLA